MVARLTSLRLWLLAAMLVAAVIGLGGAYFLFTHVQNARQLSADREKARRTAAAIAAQAAAGALPSRFAGLQEVLPNDQIIVFRNGRRIFVGPSIARDLEVEATATHGDARVTLRDYESAPSGATLLYTLIAGGGVLLVILAAWLMATLLTRAVRGPIERAVDAADRLAAGDLSARMGVSGPDELVRLGRAFDSMADRLETADQEQRRFLADVAHEIATPTNALAGYGMALVDGTLETDEEREEARALIESETQRLVGLIGDLRSLTTLDLAEDVRRERLDLAEVCRGAAARFAPAARAAGLSLRTACKETVVESDRRLLEMILDNLLSNAIRYTPAGGSIELALRRGQGVHVLAVRDTGIGIAPEQQRRVFDRLYRVDEARDRARGGSGLGLAIALRAAQALGGRIELTSEPGRGSEFRLVVPAEGRRRLPRPARTRGSGG